MPCGIILVRRNLLNCLKKKNKNVFYYNVQSLKRDSTNFCHQALFRDVLQHKTKVFEIC